jgi:Ca-activated chloride channel family protein
LAPIVPPLGSLRDGTIMHIATKTIFKPLTLALLTALFFWFFPASLGQAKAQAPAAAPTAPAPAPAPGTVRLNDVESGGLLLKTQTPGYYLEAPRVAADVSIDVTGLIVRARVTQRFENPSDQWVEGVYVFPLPADAGVDRLRMLIGDRFIEGQIKERVEARRIYEEARAAGQRAGLVEQERPNMFTSSVANIGPGETVVVQIEYQEVARLDDGVFSLRFPMVVGPRYSPAPDMLQTVDLDPRSGFAARDPVPDRDRISPPVLHPALEPTGEPRLPVSISVDLNAGFALAEVKSLYHPVVVEMRDDGRRAVLALDEGYVPANRDFALEWRAADDATPQAAAFAETREDGTYLLAMVVPPAELTADAARRPREAIFVIDNSGSMAGASMPQAKAALVMALDRLTEDDSFNVIRFDDTLTVLFPEAVPATARNVTQAKRYVAGLDASGGTEMLPALEAALVDPTPADAIRVRQVVFLTDGAIGNEAALFAAIDRGLGRSRLFTVGIGSAPNTYFMSRAARIGRGTFTHIGNIAEVQSKSEALFAALERPVMTDLLAEFPTGAASESWPNPLPDLYDGEPVVLTAKLEDLDGTLRISGDLAGRRWAADLNLADAAHGEGVAQAWAHAKIEAIEEQRFTGGDPTAIDAGVLETALAYSLVSRLTSLVAVDVTPVRPENARIARADVPTMLPAGWEFDKVFGADVDAFVRDTIAPAPGLQDILLRLDPAAPANAEDEAGLPLPQGATTFELQMLLGLMLVLSALARMAWGRRRA